MQSKLSDLLEELDKAYPERKGKLTVNELLERDIPFELILEGLNKGLILNADEPKINRTYDKDMNRAISCILSITGFEYLNQIRLKTAVEQLDDSIKKFNESSDKSSRKMIELTWAIYTFTVIVVALPIFEKVLPLLKLPPVAEIVSLIGSVLLIVIFMSKFYKVYEKK